MGLSRNLRRLRLTLDNHCISRNLRRRHVRYLAQSAGGRVLGQGFRPHGRSVGWSIGGMVGQMVGWVDRSVGWSVGRMVDRSDRRSVGWYLSGAHMSVR